MNISCCAVKCILQGLVFWWRPARYWYLSIIYITFYRLTLCTVTLCALCAVSLWGCASCVTVGILYPKPVVCWWRMTSYSVPRTSTTKTLRLNVSIVSMNTSSLYCDILYVPAALILFLTDNQVLSLIDHHHSNGFQNAPHGHTGLLIRVIFLLDLLHSKNLFEFFNFATMLWEPGHVTHVLSLTTQDRVFICMAGMPCILFQDCLDETTTAKVKPHIHTNLAGECNQVWEDSKCSYKGKARELQVPTIEDTIVITKSNIKVVNSSPLPPISYHLKRPTPTPDSSDIEFTPIHTPSQKCCITANNTSILIKQEPMATNFFALPSTSDIDDPINADAPLAVVDAHSKLLYLLSPSRKATTNALAEKHENSINNIN